MLHQSYHNTTNETELYALFGLQYILGVQKASKVNINQLWSNRCGITICRATVTEQRFHFLLVCLRFDDKTTRETRVYSDNLVAIWEIWISFIDNCGKYYNPSSNLITYWQLSDCRANWRFQVYMKLKPARYGLKIFMMNDSLTWYSKNSIIRHSINRLLD